MQDGPFRDSTAALRGEGFLAGSGGPRMDDLTERDIAPSVGTDAVSELLPLLQSEDWQRRLEAARQQREKILAERGPAPQLPPRPVIPRLEVVSSTPQVPEPLSRIEPLSGLRAGPVPRTDLFPAEDEEFEEFDDISAPPPQPLPGLRIVSAHRLHLLTETRPIPVAPAPALLLPAVAPAAIPANAPSTSPAAQKSWLTTGKIAGGFALGIAIGLGFSLTSVVTGLLTTSSAPGAVLPASPPAVPAPAVLAPAAIPSATGTGQQPGPAAADLPQPKAGTVPATPGILAGSTADSEPQLPVAISPPALSAQPEASVPLKSEAPPRIAAALPLAGVAETDVIPAPPSLAADDAAVRLAAPVSLSPLLGPAVLGVALQPDAVPLATTGPDAILAATDLTTLAALAPPEISARLPAPGFVPARLAAPQTGAWPAPDMALSSPEAPPALPPVAVQLFVPSGLAGAETQSTTERVAAAGFVSAEAHVVGVTVKTTHVRYYREEDRLLAEKLAEAIGGKARSFIGSDDAPATGVIELWLAGAPDAPAVATKSKPAKTAKAAKPAKQKTAAAKPAASKSAANDPIQAKKSAIAEKFSLEKFN